MGSPSDHLLGTRIGRIRIVDLLGAGGMGEVYVGFDSKLERRVAVKRLKGEWALDAEAKARFLQEARILSRLAHRHICAIHDLVEHDGDDYLVLELIEGRTLGELMGDGALRRDERLRIAMDIAEVLVAAHAAGIVHRDLKPSNVMLTGDGEVKVLDFGLARSVDAPAPRIETVAAGRPDAESGSGSYRTFAGALIGTPRYMSPEQARGEPVTVASDMYSFGLLLHELLCGESAYDDARDHAALLRQAKQAATRPPRGVSRPLGRLLAALESAEPADRPSADQTLARLRWIADTPRRRLRRGLAAALAALAMGGAAKYTFDLRRERHVAITARDHAQAARQQAENLVGFLVDDLAEELEPVGRLDLLERVARQAVAYYDAVPAGGGSEAEAGRALARRRIAEVFQDQGDLPAARASIEQALAIDRALLSAAEPAGALLHAQRLAEDENVLGGILVAQGEHGAAVAAARREIELVTRLVAAAPADPDRRARLAYAHYALGSAIEHLAGATAAIAEYERALALQRLVVARRPEQLTHHHRLAVFLAWLGQARSSLGEVEAAAATYREALEVRGRLVAAAPEHHHWRFALTWDLLRMGWAHEAAGRSAEAIESFRQAHDNQRRLSAHDPANVQWQRALAVTHEALGETLAAGEPRRALAEHTAALAIYESLAARDPTAELWPADVAGVLLRIGRLHRATGLTAVARDTWLRALAALDAAPTARGHSEGVATRAAVLLELDRGDDARPLLATLAERGYHDPELVALAASRGIDSSARSSVSAAVSSGLDR